MNDYFEEDAPLELTGDGELEEVSRTEITALSKLTEVFTTEQQEKDERTAEGAYCH